MGVGCIQVVNVRINNQCISLGDECGISGKIVVVFYFKFVYCYGVIFVYNRNGFVVKNFLKGIFNVYVMGFIM